MQAGVTHHIVLTDGTDTVGLMSADDMRSFLRQPVTLTSLKTASGDTLYSDLEPPYNSASQVDFSGGRGQKNLRDDATKYHDSYNVDTRFKGQLILGPKVESAAQHGSVAPEYVPGNIAGHTGVRNMEIAQTSSSSTSDEPVDATFRQYQIFTAPYEADQTLLYLIPLYVVATGAITNAVLRIYEYDGENVGTNINATNISTWTGTGTGAWKSITLTTPIALTAGAQYVLEIEHLTGTGVLKWVRNPSLSAWNGTAFMMYAADLSTKFVHTGAFCFKLEWYQISLAQDFKYPGTGSFTVQHIWLYMKRAGVVTPNITIQTVVASVPTGTLAHANATYTFDTSNYTNIPTSWGWVKIDFTDFSLTKDTDYAIVVTDGTKRHYTNCLYWAGDGTGDGYSHIAWRKYSAGSWTYDSASCRYFRINDGQVLTNPPVKFFEYKRQLYCITSPLEGNDTGRLWMNGDRGACDANTGALTTLIDGTKAWTTDGWAGCIAMIIEGPGKGEYRTIASNTQTVLTVSSAFTTTHSIASSYVILGSEEWTDITPGSGDTLDYPVSDACVVNDIVYIAQGASEAVLAYREYNNAGVWTTQNDDEDPGAVDTTATLLMFHKSNVWRVNNTNEVSYAPAVAWGTDLTFGTAIKIGSTDSDITALTIYNGDVCVGKEDGLYCIKNDVPERIDLDLQWLRQPTNCKRMKVWGVYLMLPWGDGLERLYGLQVDDMGPNRGEGLPSGRQGQIADMCPAPGQLFAAIDAGASGTSSILVNNEMGWHELVRGTAIGSRIRAMYQQYLPGGPNRLWFNMGSDVCWIRLPSATLNPIFDSAYQYQSNGSLITSWEDHKAADVQKFYAALRLATENLSGDITKSITVYYQIDNCDDDDTWELLDTFDTSPYQQIDIPGTETGLRIRFKLVLDTDDTSVTPNLFAYALQSMVRTSLKGRWEPTVWLRDSLQLLDNTVDTQTRAGIISQLDAWANSAAPLLLTTADPAWTNLNVFIEPLVETDKHYQVDETGSGADFVQCQGRLVLLEA
jgi:hypothetical protein